MNPFHGRHFQGKIILWAVRWYCKYGISYRELQEMLSERGVNVNHTTIYRWVQRYAPEIEKRLCWIQEKGLRLVVADLPITYQMIQTSDSITHSILELINNMLIDLLATMARLDNEKLIERIKQGLARSGYKPTGKKANEAKHKRIKELLAAGNMTKEEIAKAVNCGVATVYRVAKVI